jgi:hypothetical protein
VSRRGPKVTNQLDIVERVLRLLLSEPALGANEVYRRLVDRKESGRKEDVLRARRLVRAAIHRDPTLIPPRDRAGDVRRFPISHEGVSAADGEAVYEGPTHNGVRSERP